MEPYVDFVSRLIYGTGGEAVITPNHAAWVASNPSPSGTEWLNHHVDRMLPAFDTWIAENHLPPVIPWNGTRPEPWDPSADFPLGPDLDGSFTGITTLEALGAALRDRLDAVTIRADELAGAIKAPFSYRFWGYVKWAKQISDRFHGEIIVPPAHIHDWDGTPLSAIPFCDVFNELHARWHHGLPGTVTASAPTPFFKTSVGQRAGSGGVGMGGGEEFILFHRDHSAIFNRWLERQGQPAVRGRNMYNGNQGWPAPDAGTPSTWVEADDDPWINTELGDSDRNLLDESTDVDDLGNDMNFGIHGSGHTRNSDIRPLRFNNYVPRFHAWHGFIDNQLWWRQPRFARWDSTTNLRQRVFAPVLSTGDDWPGLSAIAIVRDPDAAADEIAPAGGVSGVDLATGAGTLRMKLLAQDSYGRKLRLRLKAEVFDDATSTTSAVETIPESDHTYTVGSTAAGDDFDLDTELTVDFAFSSAFQSDDPTRANPAVGFVRSRIRVTGTLEVDDGSDPGFVTEDVCDIQLVQEKEAPEIELYFDLSSFGEDQVTSAMDAGEARFAGALFVVVQDRTSQPSPPSWPSEVADELKGLIRGAVPASGLFRDAAHAPAVEILRESADTPFTGLVAELASGPHLEDASAPENLPQRFTYRYDVVFAAGNDAFDGLTEGGAPRFARVRVRSADRSGNAATVNGQLKLFKDANPYMRDGSPSWLSIDTRVFRLFEGENKFGASLSPGQPNTFIQQVIGNLNSGSTDGDTFDALPTNQQESTLEYSTAISNPSTGTSTNVHNFALAKVRLQGAGGAVDVRAFFRLFRYTSSNLIFDASTGYRAHDDGSGKKVPLLGFTEAASGGQLTSIPFFASDRVGFDQPMGSQTDTPNVQSFVAGPTEERTLYFGAYLDINQGDARLPSSYIAAHPDGGFDVGEVQSLRTLMTDAHQCMVAEIHYDGDPTGAGDTPASSDNLAQRNLMILTTDNPGGEITHTVEHSFEVDLGRRLRQKVVIPRRLPPVDDLGEKLLSQRQRDLDAELGPMPPIPLQFISSGHRERLIQGEAMSLGMLKARNMKDMMNPVKFVEEATAVVDAKFPFVFDAVQWRSTSSFLDELVFMWNDLPEAAEVELYLPRLNCEHVLSLRNLRHAPDDVRIVDSHTLALRPGGVTYVPLPPTMGGHVAGVVTVALPAGVRRGQRWTVDVVQLRGAERRTTGAFQIDIQVSEAKAIADAERRLLIHMMERLSLVPSTNPWKPVLGRRVKTLRARSKALAESAGLDWHDPTVWIDRDGQPRPLEGQRLRVVLERIQILEDRDPWFRGRGEVQFGARVHTGSNGGVLQETRFPESGVFKVSDEPGRNIIDINEPIFDGFADNDLSIELVGRELDRPDPDDTVGKYTRLFCGAPNDWYGPYGPGKDVIDPEDMVAWRIWYRIERG